ncbi:MAG: hypothetical protein IPI78_14895 [Chitinophagaceae bacterium]|nr:hypothetical protein [Chitinophagaceae bacterium]
MNLFVDQYIESLPGRKAGTMRIHPPTYFLRNVNGVEERFSYKLPVYHYWHTLFEGTIPRRH